MLINFLFYNEFNKFINFISDIFSLIMLLICFFIINILICIIFLNLIVFFGVTKIKYFNFIMFFNKLIFILFSIIIISIIFNFFFNVFLKTKYNLFYLISYIITYVSSIDAIMINNNIIKLKQFFCLLVFEFVPLLLFLIWNLFFIENIKNIKLSIIFNDIFIIILFLDYVLNVVLINKNKIKLNNKKQNNKDLKSFILIIKNNFLIMDKTIKDTRIFINGYKQIIII